MNRIDRLRTKMREEGLDALIVSSEINQRYLSRYPFTDGLLLITLQSAELLTDFRYREDAEKKADKIYTVVTPDRRFPHIREFFDADGVKTVGFENETLSCAELDRFKEQLPDYAFTGIGNTIERLREIKDDGELADIARAQDAADAALAHLLSVIKPDMTEIEVALELEFYIMELPNYRMPGMKNVSHLLWDKTKDFCERAFTVIFVATIVIWLLQTFDFRFNMVENGEGSMMAWVAGILEPLFRPLGLGDWRIVTSFVSGFLAKESVVATMEVLGVTETLTVITAVPMLIFSLLYTPCVAAISSVRRELGDRWAIYVVIFQCVIAWFVAWLGYLIAQAVLL